MKSTRHSQTSASWRTLTVLATCSLFLTPLMMEATSFSTTFIAPSRHGQLERKNAESDEGMADPDLAALRSMPGTEDEATAKITSAWQAALGNPMQRHPASMMLATRQRQKSAGSPLTAPAVPVKPPPAAVASSAVKTEEDDDKPGPVELSPLAACVISGDFPALHELLKTLPVEQSRPAYGAIVSALASDPTNLILPQEMLPLLEIAPPGALTDERLAQLGELLNRSLSQAERPGALLAALKSGKLKLGDDAPTHQMAIVKLLLAARLVGPAKEFLPELPPDTPADAPLASLHARYAYLSGVARRDQAELLKAWQLTHKVLSLPEANPLARASALRRALALGIKLPEQVSEWFRLVFKNDPDLGLTLLSEFSAERASAYQASNMAGRTRALHLQRLAGIQMLEEFATLPPHWAQTLEAMTRDWIHESQKSLGHGLQKIMLGNESQIQDLPEQFLLQVAPPLKWRQSLDADTAEHVRHLTALLAIHGDDADTAHAMLSELAPGNPTLAREIAEAFLARWGNNGESDNDTDNAMDPFAHPPTSMPRRSMGISSSSRSQTIVTRAGQLRKLAELKSLLTRFAAEGVPLLTDESVVEAFSQCHSPAEVYQERDIATIFGGLEGLTADATLALVGRMRSNLAQQWRDPQIQQQQGTKRTTPEQIAEVLKGYDLARQLAVGALARAPEHVELELALAGVFFDQAEFLYGLPADLKTYVEFRDAAFQHFQAAARAGSLRKERAPNLNVYRQWFQAALGTSDLAYLTRQDEPDKSQVQLLRDAVDREPDFVREALAKVLTQSLDSVPASLKPHFVRQALVVVGERPATKMLVDKRDFYDELLKEVELRLAVDGGDRVGHGRPFGVHISLAGTRAMVRENSAFAQILPIAAATGQNADASAPHKLLEQDLRAKLMTSFTLEQLSFFPPQTLPRETSRVGWQGLPIAYAIVRANGPASDRLPAVQFDLDFADGQGQVRLPVQSDVVLLDCREDDPPPRVARDVKIHMTLDDRELGQGVVRLEVAAVGFGVPPALNQLLARQDAPGFTTARTTEQELTVTGFDLSRHTEPLVQRRWLVEMAAIPGAVTPDFQFPTPLDSSSALTLQRFDDVDIVAALATTPLRWPALRTMPHWLWPTLGAAVLVVAVLAGVLLLRRRRVVPGGAPNFLVPDRVTPFSVLALLRRIEHDSGLTLSTGERLDLVETIAQLEQRCFTRTDTVSVHDLEPICRRWVERAAT